MTTYPNLEPNHTVEVDDEGYQRVACPLAPSAITSWSPRAEPDEINCLLCEHLRDQYPASPEHGDGDAT